MTNESGNHAMRTKRTRDPEATQEALLIAAEEVFLEKGFGNTSIADIAKRAGITKSLIHHYFGSKEGLWHAVKERRFNDYANRQMEMLEVQEPDLDLMKESFDLYFYFLKDNPQISRILAWMFLEQDQDDCMDKNRELVAKGLAQLRIIQEKGDVRGDIDVKFILFTFIGLCQHWFQDRENFLGDFFTDDEVVPENLDELYLDAVRKILFEGVLTRSD